MHAQKLETVKRLRPVIICWLIMMVSDCAAAYFLERTDGRYEFAITAIIGFFFGQFALAAILGGLLGRTWLSGWLLALFLTAVAQGVCVLGAIKGWDALRYGSSAIDERLAIGGLMPILTLAACAPLILMRSLRGWRLTLGEQTTIEKERAGVEDLLLLSVAVACSLSWLRVVSAFSRGFSETQHGMSIAAMFFGFSLLLVLPATAFTFRAPNWRVRMLGWTGIAAATCAAIIALNLFMDGSRQNVQHMATNVVVAVGACGLTMAIGNTAILASGFKLTRFAKATATELDEAAENEANTAKHRTRWQARWLTGAVVAATLIMNGWLGLADYRKIQFWENLQSEFGEQGLLAGGTVELRKDTVVSVAVGSDTTDDTFRRYQKLRDVERLSLAHSRVTDRVVSELAAFRDLRMLDLSDTALTDAGLEQVRENLNLTELAVAKTRVSPAKAIEVARSLGVHKLDISELGVDDQQLEDLLKEPTINELALRGNPITDKGIAKLMQLPKSALLRLDLSNTNIDGSGLLSANCPSFLILDGTKITDANLIALVRANPGLSVSLKNTSITAQALKEASAAGTTVALGGGKITEDDLARLSPLHFGGLSLNGPEFTGGHLSKFVLGQWLDLSHSGVNDEAFLGLRVLGRASLSSLNVAHTQITDASLASIAQIGCYDLDIRDTKITAAGLHQHLSPYRRIIIDYDQFTPAELVSLRRDFEVVIGGKLWSLPW